MEFKSPRDILDLAKEEMRHLLRLEREIQAITGTGLK